MEEKMIIKMKEGEIITIETSKYFKTFRIANGYCILTEEGEK